MATRVRTTSGEIEGLRRHDCDVFLGIPFAGSTAGRQRFLPPSPPPGWAGVRDATSFGPACPQGKHVVANMAAPPPHDEDCLSLNIYTPEAQTGGARPVFFWIHGGAFTLGAGSMPLYAGERLAARGDLVVVTINYRLGAFGYVEFAKHGGGEWGATANSGQLDQIAALEWVRDNIAAFGGDPGNVTIAGESAGSYAVSTLMAMPRARGLFHKAVMQSGASTRLASSDAAANVTEAFLTKLGNGAASDSRRSQEPPFEDVLRAQQGVLGDSASLRGFWPIRDGVTVPDHPIAAIAAGEARHIPVLLGTTRDEQKLFVPVTRKPIDDEKLARRIRAVLPRRAADRLDPAIAAYRDSRAREGLPTDNLAILDAIQTDLQFRLPTLRFAQAQHEAGGRAYLYQFNHESPAGRGRLGACHALEIPFVFGTLDAPTMDRFAGTGPDVEALSRNMMDAWIAFAKTGDPSHPGIGTWEPHDPECRATMLFDRRSELTLAPLDAERAVWDGIPF